ncbi:hypothetical protein DEO72_LG2g3380 [Vigna unguiculata]|uniref:Uncharacterized protein n=1 Tax=Vigna unguiculata TaxID=3917 RepID=A0A4D6L3C8_VIGUN|nr:hypothetical protein DEO72_LG2g3380 [Vigna unguiculata]
MVAGTGLHSGVVLPLQVKVSAVVAVRRRCCDDVRKWCSSQCCTLSVVVRGTLCARRWRCGGSRARGEDELAVVSGLAMRMRCGEGADGALQVKVARRRRWWRFAVVRPGGVGAHGG